MARPSYDRWLALPGQSAPEVALPEGLRLPTAGEDAARARWQAFLEQAVREYDRTRDLPGVEALT